MRGTDERRVHRPGGLIGRLAARLHGEQRGITLIELIVATSVFALVVSGALMGLSGAFTLTRGDRARSVAANLAAQQMDSVRALAAQDFNSIPVGTDYTSQTVDGVIYTLKERNKWVTANAEAGPCDGITGSRLSQMSIRITVTWPNMGAVSPVASQTAITPPVGVYDPETGHIGVTVLDSTGTGVEGIPVTTTGPSSYNDTEVTDVSGCAFFGFLPPGTYTTAVNTPGYVTDQEVQAASQVAAVNVGTITAIQFSYDLAGSMALTLAGGGGGIVPSTMKVTVANTRLLPTGTKTYTGTGAVTTITGLYPFTSGYQVWAGGCLDADPEAQKTTGGAFYPGAARDAPIHVPAGSPVTGNVNMATARVTVKKAGVAQVGLTVVATHAVDSVCGSGSTYTLGVTDASGVVLAALPWGTWTFSVSGKSPSGSWPAPQLSPLGPATNDVAVNIL